MSWSRRAALWGLGPGAMGLLACDTSEPVNPPFAGDDSRPPEVPDTIRAKLPPIVKHEFGSGSRLYLIRATGVPLVSVAIGVQAGFVHDPIDKGGLARVVAGHLEVEGGGPRAERRRRRYQALGCEPLWFVHSGHFGLKATVHVDDAPTLVKLFIEDIRGLEFTAESLDWMREASIAKLEAARGQPSYIGGLGAVLAVTGADPPVSVTSTGSRRTLEVLRVDDLQAWASAHVGPDRLSFAFAGDVRLEAAQDWVIESAGDWRAPKREDGAEPRLWQASAGGDEPSVLVPWPELDQPILSWASVDRPPGDPEQVATEFAQGLMNGLVHELVRTRMRVSYGSDSSVFVTHHGQIRQHYTPLASAELADVIENLVQTLAVLSRDPQRVRSLARNGLRANRLSLYTQMMLAFQGPRRSVDQLLAMAEHDLPADALQTRFRTLEALTADQVAARFAERFRPDTMVWSVVGDEATLEEVRDLVTGSQPPLVRTPSELLGL